MNTLFHVIVFFRRSLYIHICLFEIVWILFSSRDLGLTHETNAFWQICRNGKVHKIHFFPVYFFPRLTSKQRLTEGCEDERSSHDRWQFPHYCGLIYLQDDTLLCCFHLFRHPHGFFLFICCILSHFVVKVGWEWQLCHQSVLLISPHSITDSSHCHPFSL